MLHMLRNRLGDEAFFAGLKAFYEAYQGKNASSADFQSVMEIGGQTKLDDFFSQWLGRPDEPEITGTWRLNPNANLIILKLTQTQEGPAFDLPIEVGFSGADETSALQRI